MSDLQRYRRRRPKHKQELSSRIDSFARMLTHLAVLVSPYSAILDLKLTRIFEAVQENMYNALKNGTAPSERYKRFSNFFISDPPAWNPRNPSEGLVWKRLYVALAGMLRDDGVDCELESKRSGKVGLYETFGLLLKLEARSDEAKHQGATAGTLKEARRVHAQLVSQWTFECHSEHCNWRGENAKGIPSIVERASSVFTQATDTATHPSDMESIESETGKTWSSRTANACPTASFMPAAISDLGDGLGEDQKLKDGCDSGYSSWGSSGNRPSQLTPSCAGLSGHHRDGQVHFL